MAALRTHLVQAVYSWAVEAGFTPHVLVDATKPGVEVPTSYVEGGRITLNLDPQAVRAFSFADETLIFSARFGGRSYAINVPVSAILAIYARETGRGLSFEGEPEDEPSPPAPTGQGSEAKTAPHKGPILRRIK